MNEIFLLVFNWDVFLICMWGNYSDVCEFVEMFFKFYEEWMVKIWVVIEWVDFEGIGDVVYLIVGLFLFIYVDCVVYVVRRFEECS